jgi:glycosyltransferase involved in cell wall biosynthesis
MLLARGIAYDARVQRSARSLAANGYEVTVVCRSELGEQVPDRDGYRVLALPLSDAREATVARRSVRELRAVRLELETELDGSKSGRTTLKTLRRAEDLLRRYQWLSEAHTRLAAVDEPYRAVWGAVLRQEKPDVVHVHDSHGLGVALAERRPGARVVYDAHEYELGKEHRPEQHEALSAYLREHAPKADAVVTVGSVLAELLQREFELPSIPVVIHNTPPLRDAKPAPYDLRETIGLDDRTPLLVYTGGVTRHRRLTTPLGALRRLPGVHLALVLISDPSRAQELTSTAERLGVRDRLHIAPPVPHDSLVALTRSADAGILPLERYPNGDIAMPNKLFEYLHAGLPMVMSDSPEIAAFVRRHRLGEVAPVDDEEAWAAAVARVLGNPRAYEGKPAAREHLRREWSWETQERTLLELYERMSRERSMAAELAARVSR